MQPLSIAMEAATAGAGTITTEDGQLFSFSAPMRKVIFQNNGTTDLYVTLNGTTAYTDDYDFRVEADGGTFVYTDELNAISSFAAYTATDPTYGTGWVAGGFPWRE